MLLIFDYLDTTKAAQPDASALHKQLACYEQIPAHRLEQMLLHLSGRATWVWTLSDFDAKLKQPQWRDNLFFFSLEFIGELCREKGIPYSKGELCRSQLLGYLNSRRRSGKGKAINFLLPRKDSLDRYLAELLNVMAPQLYKAGCLMELLPHYLEFLSRRQFISEEDVTRIVRSMGQLPQQLSQILQYCGADRILLRAVQESWAFAPLTGNQPGA